MPARHAHAASMPLFPKLKRYSSKDMDADRLSVMTYLLRRETCSDPWTAEALLPEMTLRVYRVAGAQSQLQVDRALRPISERCLAPLARLAGAADVPAQKLLLAFRYARTHASTGVESLNHAEFAATVHDGALADLQRMAKALRGSETAHAIGLMDVWRNFLRAHPNHAADPQFAPKIKRALGWESARAGRAHHGWQRIAHQSGAAPRRQGDSGAGAPQGARAGLHAPAQLQPSVSWRSLDASTASRSSSELSGERAGPEPG